MRLSYCMIVKNEAETLEKNLENARPHVDEMVIVDTGSDDGTKEIAQEYADKYKEIEWPDSFSEARNVTLEMAEGDYVMYLDGDEAITEEEHWFNIRGLLTKEDPDGVAIQIENDLPGNQLLEGDRIWEVRIFRNHPDVRFKGRVHNQITPAIKKQAGGDPDMVKVEAVSHHIGYSHDKEDLKKKYEKRIPLLRKEVEDAESDRWEAYYRYQLVNGLFMLEKHDEAHEVMKTVNEDVLTEENRFSFLLMAVHICLERDTEQASQYGTDMIDLWGQEPIAYLMKGIAELRLGRDNAALTLILAAMQTSQARPDVRYDIDVHYAASAAGEAALKMEMYERAKNLFQFHLEKYPQNERVRSIEQSIQPVPQDSQEAMKETPTQPSLRNH